MEAQAITVERPFAAAKEQFSDLVGRLSTSESRWMTHIELESLSPPRRREIIVGSCISIWTCVVRGEGPARCWVQTRSSIRIAAVGLAASSRSWAGDRMRMTYGAHRHRRLSPLENGVGEPLARPVGECIAESARGAALAQAAAGSSRGGGGSFDAAAEAIGRNTGTGWRSGRRRTW